jgi:DNA polymerase III subunit delta
MKIPAQQLANHLRQKLAPIYLLSGDDPYLLQDTADAVCQRARANEFIEREIFQVETNNFDWKGFVIGATNASIFAEKILIELHLPTNKLNDTGKKAIQDYAANPNPDRVLLITMPKLDAAAQKAAWITTIDKIGLIVQIWPLDAKQIPAWLQNKAKQLQLNISIDALKMLAEYTSGNLLAANQELEKLQLLYPDEQNITLEQLTAAIADNSRFNVFDLINNIYTAQSATIIRICNNLRDTGAEPAIILWALAREIRLLIKLMDELRQNPNQDCITLLKKYHVHYQQQPLIQRSLKKLKLPELNALLQHVAKIDLIIKGAVTDCNVWHELITLILRFATILQ